MGARMPSADQILASLKVARPVTAPGNWTTVCPKCLFLRPGRARRKQTFHLAIAGGLVAWRCSHCHYAGAEHYDEQPDRKNGGT